MVASLLPVRAYMLGVYVSSDSKERDLDRTVSGLAAIVEVSSFLCRRL
jgi:hypothetical protein